jgi:hypothetical protein
MLLIPLAVVPALELLLYDAAQQRQDATAARKTGVPMCRLAPS